MAGAFQPNVFQPNVFQVGTLDVVIPGIVTKHRKWLSLSVPSSGRKSGVPAFAVSRDSAGILIGVRDKAAPQFAVSRDADGLLLSAWPGVPPLPVAYVVSGYVLGLTDTTSFGLQMFYRDAAFSDISASYLTQVTTSSTDWQRIYATAPVPANAAYVQAGISCPSSSSSGAYWTAVQLEGGAVASAYGVGGANLILNPEFATDLSYWSQYGLLSLETTKPLSTVFSRATSLPSVPLPGVTTALKYVSRGYVPGSWYTATHRTIALPTP